MPFRLLSQDVLFTTFSVSSWSSSQFSCRPASLCCSCKSEMWEVRAGRGAWRPVYCPPPSWCPAPLLRCARLGQTSHSTHNNGLGRTADGQLASSPAFTAQPTALRSLATHYCRNISVSGRRGPPAHHTARS